MDFKEILLIASKGQGINHVPKRYSLAVGPPKKDPKVKGVQPAAVQAFLRRKEEALRRTALEEKRRREELVRKRIELKHDRRARAMARRTKDNFHGYDGIPVKEKTKKRQRAESRPNQGTDPESEVEAGEFLDYSLGELEQEFKEDQEPLKAGSQSKAPLKRAPPPMTFTDLMRLAEKKQFEPVEVKAVRKAEERPLTAKELREREFLERMHKNKKPEAEAKLPLPVSPSHKDSVGTKPSKGSGDRQPSSKGLLLPPADKTFRPSTGNEKQALSPCKSTPGERTKTGSGSSSQPSYNRLVFLGVRKPQPSTCSPTVPKTSASGTQKSASEQKARKPLPSLPSHSKPGPTAFPHSEAKSPGIRQPGSNSDSASGRPSPGTARPTVSSGAIPRRQNGSSSSGPEQSGSGIRKLASHPHPSGQPVNGTNGPGRPASSSTGPGRPISGPGGSGRPLNSSGGPRWPVNSPHDNRRPVSSLGPPGQSVSGPGRSLSGSVPAGRTVSSGPGRPVSSLGPGRTVSSPGLPIKPKCTVVSETISSKNIFSKSSNGPINGRKPLPSGYRSVPGPQRLPFPTGYKRLRECKEESDDEYDSDMDDFIDDEGDPQEEISKHIREIFGYDRRKYKDESDYSLRYMESSWQEQQKEEAKSLRLGRQEDFLEMKREEEEMKRRKAKKRKLPDVSSC